jgi:AmmeMemoRadiSam system protein A
MPLHSNCRLSDEERRALLAVARGAISQTLTLETVPTVPAQAGRLAEPAGAFVTLRRNGKLRGCVGRLEPADPLAEIVAQSAITAAFADSRFHPVTVDELPHLEIEISVLSEPWSIQPAEVELGIHGIVVSCGANRGLLLPQVPLERNWSANQFLETACRKAGLRSDGWRDPETRLFAFTAEVFSESRLLAVDQTLA